MNSSPSPSGRGAPDTAWDRYRLFLRLMLHRLRRRRPILVVLRVAGMGDVIATLPACRHLVKKFPQRRLVYVTNPAFAEIFGMAGFPVEVVPDRRAALPVLAQKFFPYHRLLCADDVRAAPTVDFVQDFARSCGVELEPEERPRLHPPAPLLEKIRQEARALAGGGKLVVIHAGPTDRVREWPKARWIELVRRLREEMGATVVQLGVEFHTRWGAAQSTHVEGAIDYLNRLSLTESACWIAAADVFIGIDSGLLQMAPAVGTPAIAVLGPTEARFRFDPTAHVVSVSARELPCLGCHHRVPRGHWDTGCPLDIACMTGMSGSEVFRAASRELGAWNSE